MPLPALPHLPLRALALAGALILPSAALADTRIFIIENSDGYGVDGCLASGAPCGQQVAAAWCRSHDYASAVEFGRAEAETLAPTSVPASAGACSGPACSGTVAITCSR